MIRKLCPYIFLTLGCGFLVGCGSPPRECALMTQGTCTLAPKKATSKPYQIKGVWYYPQAHYEYDEVGIASFYGGGDVFHGRSTATGERFDMNGITAAHKTLPLPCIAEVTNMANGRQIIVKVNDRGPFIGDRMIDVSRRVAQLLGFEQKGTAQVRVRTLLAESLALNGITAPQTTMLGAAPAVAIPAETMTIAALIPEEGAPMVSSQALPVVQSKHGIFIDVGKCATQQQASSLSQQVRQFGNVPLQPIEKGGETPYVVRMGPFPNMVAANEVLDLVGGAGHTSRIVIIHP